MRLRSTPTGITRRRALQSLAVGLPTIALGAARPTRLKLSTAVLKDPDGHRSTLRLRGDWIFIAISDGKHSGIGEISHSTDDGACLHRIRQLFSTHLAERSPSLAALSELHAGPFGAAPDLIAATAISGIDQAIHDLIAKREGIPVWQLYSQSAAVDRLPFYFSINRALTTRAPAEFVRLTTVCRNLGVPAVKIMPFEAVTAGTEQIEQSREGFARIEAVRTSHPDVSLRVDCHERFTFENAAALLQRFETYRLDWLEEPCATGPDLLRLRKQTTMKFAAGELLFGPAVFEELLGRWGTDFVIPDPKYVGGFGPLIKVCRLAERLGGEVSPHNPSGPISTRVCLHAAAVSRKITSMEMPLASDPRVQPGRELREGAALMVPTGPGWGVTVEEFSAVNKIQFSPA